MPTCIKHCMTVEADGTGQEDFVGLCQEHEVRSVTIGCTVEE